MMPLSITEGSFWNVRRDKFSMTVIDGEFQSTVDKFQNEVVLLAMDGDEKPCHRPRLYFKLNLEVIFHFEVLV
jgi:hypothetical protein